MYPRLPALTALLLLAQGTASWCSQSSASAADDQHKCSQDHSLFQPRRGMALLQMDQHTGEKRKMTEIEQEDHAIELAQTQKKPAVGNLTAPIGPFGRESTGDELQKRAAATQDQLVDAVESAEVSEIKRSITRSLARLRAAEIKEFDVIARLETQAIDAYNDKHNYRSENPITHLDEMEDMVAEDKYTAFHK